MAMTISFLEMPTTRIRGIHNGGRATCSNYNIKKTVPMADARRCLKEWSRRQEPGQFRILGGEPFPHPDLPEIMSPNVERFERPANQPQA